MIRLLVVDEDPHLREVLCYICAKEGWIPEVATTTEEALARISCAPPTLVLLGVHHPPASWHFCSVPCIHIFEEEEDCPIRPFSPRLLIQRIHTFLSLQKSISFLPFSDPLRLNTD